jgi:hypothetical protein
MPATRAYFGFPRVTESFTLSGGSWLATYPISNLQVLPLSYVARTLNDDLASTVIVATASAPVSASVLALVGHNISGGATARVRIWSDVAGTGLVYDNTGNVWPAAYTTDEIVGAVWTWVHRFADPGPITVGKIQIDISDTSNVYGFVQAGFLEIAGAFDTTYNFEFGSQYGFRWRSEITEAIGGSKYIDNRNHPRIFKGNFPVSPRSDSMGKFFEMQRQGKSHKPILFVPLPTETTHLLRTVMFAHQLDPGLSTMRSSSNLGLLDSVPLALEEIVG